MNTNVITIVVDNINRTLSYDGGQLILGVLNDDCAQAVYFDCPNKINSIMDGINSDDYAVFVCYKNAIGAIIRQESEKIYADGDAKIQFKWTITNDVTARAGNVSFSLCIEKKDENGKVGAEWHTTNNLVGKVLDAIHTNNYTTEEHVHDKTTYQAMQTQYAELTSQLKDVEGYIDEEVANQVTTAIESEIEKIKPYKATGKNALASDTTSNGSSYYYTPDLYDYDEVMLTFTINNPAAAKGIYFYSSSADLSNPITNVIFNKGFYEVFRIEKDYEDKEVEVEIVSPARFVIRCTKVQPDIIVVENMVFDSRLYDPKDETMAGHVKADYCSNFIVDANETSRYRLTISSINPTTLSNIYLTAK